jgi:predicted small lipoprotein YifL
MRAERRESQSVRGRRGKCRAVLFFALLAMVLALAGCGKSGKGASTDSEKAADVELLNGLLAHELTLLDAYAAADGALKGQALAVAGAFRGQGLAHVDAIEKAIRGLGGRAEAEAGSFEPSNPRSRREALELLYAEESAALGLAGEAAPHMEAAAPSNLAVALAANHAAHLAVLRQTLGEPLVGAVPAPLETGSVPPPGSPPEEGG